MLKRYSFSICQTQNSELDVQQDLSQRLDKTSSKMIGR